MIVRYFERRDCFVFSRVEENCLGESFCDGIRLLRFSRLKVLVYVAKNAVLELF